MSVSVKLIARCTTILAVMLMLGACTRYHQPAYFEKGALDSTMNRQYEVPEAVIQRGDLLGITIYSDNPAATAIFNQAGLGNSVPVPSDGVSASVKSASPANGSSGPSYLVDQRGQIRLHAIGKLSVEGMTKDQVADLITGKLNTLGVLSNPYCVVRFNNFKVTVIGEVRNPGVFTLPAEKARILEVIGLAGDFTNFGERDKVLLVREFNGERTYQTVDLTDPKVFDSPNFYIRQNDVLVVKANAKKPTEADQTVQRYITIGATIVSTIAVVVALFR